MKIETYENLPTSQCPTCGYKVDSASRGATIFGPGTPPVPGDLSLCFKCGELLAFDKDLKLQLAGIDDVLGLSYKEFKIMEETQDMIRRERPLG